MPGVNSGTATKDFDFTRVKADGDTVALAFSCGKDSVAAFLYMRENGLKVIPYFQYDIADIGFVERSLDYYEQYFGCHILRVLCPTFYEQLRCLVFQPPDRAAIIYDLDLPKFDHDDLQRGVRRTIGMPNAWIAIGTKRNDSLMRRMRIPPNGLNTAKREFHPLVEWTDNEVINLIARHGVKVPVDYALFGISVDGYQDYRFVKQVRDFFPEDYEKVREWFPLIDMEMFRVEVANRHGQNSKTNATAQRKRTNPTS